MPALRPLPLALCAALAAPLAGCPTLGDALPSVPLGPIADTGPAPDLLILPSPDFDLPDARARDAAPEGPPDVRPVDAALDAAPRLDAAPCAPGDSLGLCMVCGDDGEAVMPEDDPDCPPLDCGALDRYERFVEDSLLICTADRRVPRDGTCRALGACHDEIEVYCGAPRPVDVEIIVPGPCIAMDGCDSVIPPQLDLAPEGTPCHEIGTCDGEGACSAFPDCVEFDPGGASLFCAARDGIDAYCEFFLELGMPIDCGTFCDSYGWGCVDAWNTPTGVCEHPDAPGAGCARAFDTFVCRCRP